jgi:hypothetical protein
MDVTERARRYIQMMPAAVSGQGGHSATFHAAGILVHGFALSRDQALSLLGEWNHTHTGPDDRWSAAELEHKVDSAIDASWDKPRGWLLKGKSGDGNGAGVAPEPAVAPRSKLPDYDPAKLGDYAARCGKKVDLDWIRRASPIGIPDRQDRETAHLFLSTLYRPDERVLIFLAPYTQGDFLVDGERGSFRLAARPGVSAVASALPPGGPEGVWFLTNPVGGTWQPNTGKRDRDGNVLLGRRHGACVTNWRYLVIESDEAPADLWLRAIVQLPVPIVAIYTSGGRSIHALVRLGARSKKEWDSLRDMLKPILGPLGADPRAMTAVRLSRLPGMLRHGTRGKDGKRQGYERPRLQRLLYLNPTAPAAAILELVKG